MRVLCCLLAIIPATASADYKLQRSNDTATHDCDRDNEVTIDGIANSVTLTGTCKKVLVRGVDNKLTIATTRRLSIMGDRNTVSIDATDEVSVHGTNNAVSYARTISGKPLAPKVHGNSRVQQRPRS